MWPLQGLRGAALRHRGALCSKVRQHARSRCFCTSRTTLPRHCCSADGSLGKAADIRAFALEALPATHEALAAAPDWARAPPGIVSILNLAGDATAGTVLFGRCNVASEVCTIEKDGSNAVSVPSVSVDAFRTQQKISEEAGGVRGRSAASHLHATPLHCRRHLLARD